MKKAYAKPSAELTAFAVRDVMTDSLDQFEEDFFRQMILEGKL